MVNLPVVVVVFIALQKKIIIMGVTHKTIIQGKDEEIAFREKLRQEGLIDKAALELRAEKNTEATNELTLVVSKSMELNERLLSEDLAQRWDGNDRRRAPKAPTRAR